MKTKKNIAAKKSAKKTAAPKYTRLDCEDVGEIIANATDDLIANPELADDIAEKFEVEEYEEAAGTFFIQYDARTWRDGRPSQDGRELKRGIGRNRDSGQGRPSQDGRELKLVHPD